MNVSYENHADNAATVRIQKKDNLRRTWTVVDSMNVAGRESGTMQLTNIAFKHEYKFVISGASGAAVEGTLGIRQVDLPLK